jgi:hypothetical protein
VQKASPGGTPAKQLPFTGLPRCFAYGLGFRELSRDASAH